MIALGLMVVAGIYLLLFLVVGFVAKRWRTRLVGWCILLAPIIWKTWDIPVGHYKFKKLCEQEAGIKIYVPNPKPAKRIRLEGEYFSDAFAESYLQRYPSLQQIEAKDKKYNFVSEPVAYALYERDKSGKVVSRLMDKVARPYQGSNLKVVEAAPSHAEYFLSYEHKEYPYRIWLERFSLRSADNVVIGAVNQIYYAWSNPDNTLYGRTYKLEECGSDKEERLIQLITALRREK